MPTAFLMQQMSWREALDEARALADLETLHDDVHRAHREALTRCEHCIDHAQDLTQAAQEVRALMFIERFARAIDQRLDALDAS
jgi:molecular chaperone HscB